MAEKPPFRIRRWFDHVPCDTPGGGEMVTKQEFKTETTIEAIMRKWAATGTLKHMMATEPQYGDFTNADDYLTAMNRVTEARDQFMQLPAELRQLCGNDPGAFLDLVHREDSAEVFDAFGLKHLHESIHGEVGKKEEGASTSAAPTPPAPSSKPTAEPAESESVQRPAAKSPGAAEGS